MTETKTSPNLGQHTRSALIKASKLHWIHWLVIIASMALTITVWKYSDTQANQKLEDRFNRESGKVVDSVLERMVLYENALWGGVAHLDATKGQTSSADWKLYANSLRIDQAYPGINGIGVIYNIQKNELAAYLQQETDERPDYGIHPSHQQDEYWPITHIEPVASNKKAVGLDMAFETTLINMSCNMNRNLSAIKSNGTGSGWDGGRIMYILLLAGVLFNGSLSAREGVIKYPLSVSDNGRFLLQSDGKPFFFLGCTAWQFFAELSREEGDAYMEDRRQKEFTVIQACAVGIGWGNPTHKEGNAYGDIPFNNNDVSQPKVTDGSDPDNAWQYDYWDNVDYLVKSAEEKGLVIAFLPTFSTTFNQGAVPSDAKAGAYGAFLGKRYKNSPNIIWVLGGDIKCQDVTSKVRAMAQGILSEDKNHLITYHPSQASSTCFHNDDWLDFNMIQTSHGSKDNAGSYTKIIHDFNLKPTKPCMDGEPRYEDHKIGWKDNNGCFNDYDARQAAYWSVFAGAHGHTYGHVNIWSFGPNNTACYDYDWRTAAARPGNGQMTHLHRLLKSVDQLKRVPDQSLIASGEGSGADHKRAMRASDGSYGFIYAPSGGSFSVNLNKLSGDMISAQWLDPREGTYRDAGAFSNSASRSFTAPGEKKRGNDWVLVLRDMSAVHPAAPGELTAVNATDTSVELQ